MRPNAPKVKPTIQELAELIEHAKKRLGEYADEFVATGVLPSHMLGGEGGGPRVPRRGYTRQVIWLERPDPAEWADHLAWHDYWDRVGYRNQLDPKYRAECPVERYGVRARSVFAAVDWATIRRALLNERQAEQAGQLTLI